MLEIYQVDAFTKDKFKGNPAGVCPLQEWLPDADLQNIASELNLSETAFFVPLDNGFHLRWFTPTTEVRLCGHATLAAAHVIFSHLDYKANEICFKTNKVGELNVYKLDDAYQMNFPVDIPQAFSSNYINQLINTDVLECRVGTDDLLLLVRDHESVKNCRPNLEIMKSLEHRAIIVTAQGRDVDFVSRVFAPAVGIDEDPVTGSAHTVLTPFWAEKLNKKKLSATQISERSGNLSCELNNDRVLLTGNAVTTIVGKIL